MAMQAPLDPSRSSYYISDALYRDLIADFSEWQDDALAVTDVFVRDEFRQLLEREARLLDQLRYDEWLAMYAPECVYWVPSTPNRGDPRREIAIMFDDRRRLEIAFITHAHRVRVVASAGVAHGAAYHQRRGFLDCLR